MNDTKQAVIFACIFGFVVIMCLLIFAAIVGDNNVHHCFDRVARFERLGMPEKAAWELEKCQ